MTDFSLTQKSGLDRAWAEGISRVFPEPDNYLERLCGLAEKEQNLTRAMDWDTVNLKNIPLSMRQGAANMFAQFHYGETMGILCVSRMIDLCPSGPVKRCFESQAIDEARHVKWLTLLMRKLECEGEINTVSEQLMTEIHQADTLEKLVIGIHVFIEGLAHSYCMEGARAFSGKPGLKAISSAYRSASKVAGDWLPNFIGRDESRHIAFGNYFLGRILPELTPARRNALEHFTERLGLIIVEGVRHPGLVFAPDLDGRSVGARSLEKLNRQLAGLGIEARIPDVYAST